MVEDVLTAFGTLSEARRWVVAFACLAIPRLQLGAGTLGAPASVAALALAAATVTPASAQIPCRMTTIAEPKLFACPYSSYGKSRAG